MATTTASGLPREIAAGDSLTFSRPAPIETSRSEFFFVHAADRSQRWKTSGAVDPGDANTWLYSIDPALTADLKPGVYAVTRIDHTTDADAHRTTTDHGTLTLLPNLEADFVETHPEKMVRLIEAKLEGRAVDGLDSHTINGQSIALMSVSELKSMRNQYLDEVRRANGQQGRRILTQFVNA